MTAKKAAIIFLLLVTICSFGFAQQPLIEVKAQVDTSVITIGDKITYSIIIDRAKDLRIIRPGEGINLGSFEIKGYHFPKPQVKDNRVIERFDFTISVYDTGTFVIPPYPVAYFPSDTSKKYQVVEAPAIEIHVKSVLTGSAKKELKDIKGPIDIPFNYKFWISVAVVLVLLVLIGYLLYRLYKKRKERGYLITPPPPPRPAHEIALEALNKLFSSDLIEQGKYKEFYSRLSEILRTYLEGRYFFPAMEETTREILTGLKENEPSEERYRELEYVLTLSDLVKFAKYVPDEREIKESREKSLQFVEATKIVFAPQEEEKNGAQEPLMVEEKKEGT